MNEIIDRTSIAAIVPVPASPIAIRVATLADLPFLDALQKQHSKALGFFPRAQMEGYVKNGWVLIAEDAATRTPLGYCASRDRYLKRDELGVIYQLCVAPGHQRGLIGASLIKTVFERSPYGCRLYCCWCAQDLDANYFWESLGFIPIAFRAGSTGKKRVHIFWQRRVVDGDATPWWYPSQTNAGAIREDRLVFPIPPGTHWRDIRPLDIRPPDVTAVATATGGGGDAPALPSAEAKPKTVKRSHKPMAVPRAELSHITSGGLRFAAPQNSAVAKPPRIRPAKSVVKACPAFGSEAQARRERSRRIDPRLFGAARELRDRWMERVNDPLVFPATAMATSLGKYDVSSTLRLRPEGSRSLDGKTKAMSNLAAG